MRLGILDVGSNTVHLLVVDAEPGSRPVPAADQRWDSPLLHQVGEDHAVSPEGQQELLDVIGRYVEIREDVIRVNLGRSGDTSLLEINVEIDGAKVRPTKNGSAEDGKSAVARIEPGAAASSHPNLLASEPPGVVAAYHQWLPATQPGFCRNALHAP